jgi:hypothetical protein
MIIFGQTIKKILEVVMFNFDESKVPEVVHKGSWPLQDGTEYSHYEANGWTFEYPEETIDDAERSIYAFIAWRNWLENEASSS